MRWLAGRRRAVRRITTGAVAVALVAAPVTAAAHAAEPGGAPPQALLSVDFEDGGTGALTRSGAGGAVVALADGNHAYEVARTQSYDGLQTPAGLTSTLPVGTSVTVSMRVRLADGTVGSQHARWVAKPGYTWIGDTAVDASGWTTVSGTFTTTADARDVTFYTGTGDESGAAFSYLVDDVTVTTAATSPGGDGCTYPTTSAPVSSTFEDGSTDGWVPRDDGHGTATVAVTDGGHDSDHALLVSHRARQGQGVGYDVTCVLRPGDRYQFSGWVRFAAGQPADEVWLSVAATTGTSTAYSTLAQFTDVTSTGWTHVTGTFTMPTADSALLYLETRYLSDGSAGNTSDLLLDDLAVTSAPAQVQDVTPLKDTVDFPVGVAIDSRETSGAGAQLVAKHFDQVTPENFMKPEAWYDADHRFVTENAEADAVMDLAQKDHLRVYGHTLVWHSQTPAWFFEHDDGTPLTSDAADQAVLRDRMRTHIDSVARYLADRYGAFGSATNPLVAFDVVNEVVSDASDDPDGMRQSPWYRVLGESFVEDAFRVADEAFNHTYAAAGATRPVTLFINDYNTEQGGKRARLLALVQRLVADGVPVDGVGHQFHVSTSTPVSSLRAALADFSGIVSDGHPLYQAVTELDVPSGTPVTDAALVDQGYYYQQVFDLLREQQTSAHLFSATVWGLTDSRSWRADQGAPLLFDDDYQVKDAYLGATDQPLPPRQRSAVVFRGDVPLGSGATTSPVWARLPLHQVSDAAAFQLRWEPDHLTAYVTVSDATPDQGDGLAFTVGDQVVTVPRTGADPAVATVTPTAGGYAAVVHLPLSGAAQGQTAAFDVRVTDGTATTGWSSGGTLGTLQLVEPLSSVAVPEARVAPEIDGVADGVWAGAPSVTTGTQVSGTGGASADVRTLWRGSTLYVLADVTDPTVDLTASDPWSQDSVELFVDPGNAKNGSYRPEDTQIRISADNVLSFGTGDEAAQRARVASATARTDHGYLVEAAVDLLGNGGTGAFEGFDVQVNDATAGSRTAIRTWADPTGNGYRSTSRWGVAELVAAPVVNVAPKVTQQPRSTSAPLGRTVRLTAKASGTPTPTVTWQRRVPGSRTWTTVRGAHATTLEVAATRVLDGARYRAVFTNVAGKAVSHEATVTVTRTRPVITHQPASVSTRAGKVATFRVVAHGYPAPTYRWFVKKPGSHVWVPAPHGRSSVLALVAGHSRDGWQVRVVVTNRVGAVTSSTATLRVR